MKTKRSAGILMPVFSLASPYGIGTLGKAAYEFVDFLYESGQSWWQVLPLGPTSYGDSPYQSFSTFAGNPYFIDLDFLIEDGLLTKDFVNSFDWGKDSERVDYEKIYNSRFIVLRKVFENGFERDRAEFERFVENESEWLPEYALFMALKCANQMRPWSEWPREIRFHSPDAVSKARLELGHEIQFFEYIQYLFFGQWKKLQKYARQKGIGIIGDVPIYVAFDSADVWSSPQFFKLDENRTPMLVAGVPPDYFTKDGQLWGNPLYDWDALKSDGYGWWIRRIDGASRLYDIIRIDHFRGFESYWAVPFGDKTAKNGKWIKGPGLEFVNILTSWFVDTQFIAEDLGVLTPEVEALLKDSKLPGMKVLEFAFDSKELSDYLPHTYKENCVCYIGTHDNNTLLGWLDEMDDDDIAFAKEYLGVKFKASLPRALIRTGLASVADLFIVQIQDYLRLDEDSRINTPGTLGGNWQWRLIEDEIENSLDASDILRMIKIYGRQAGEE